MDFAASENLRYEDIFKKSIWISQLLIEELSISSIDFF
jgi:hypothetical protein